MPLATVLRSGAARSFAEPGAVERLARWCSYGRALTDPCARIAVLCCPRGEGRLRLVALMTEPKEIARYLLALGEPTTPPERGPARGPPFWSSRALRCQSGDVVAA